CSVGGEGGRGLLEPKAARHAIGRPAMVCSLGRGRLGFFPMLRHCSCVVAFGVMLVGLATAQAGRLDADADVYRHCRTCGPTTVVLLCSVLCGNACLLAMASCHFQEGLDGTYKIQVARCCGRLRLCVHWSFGIQSRYNSYLHR